MSESIIQVRSLRKSFSKHVAVDNIDFEVKRGQCFGLLGPNGAGKTTTIEMLEGLVKPDSGDILFYGEPVKKQVYDKVGIQFQSTALQDYLTTKETIELFSAFYPNALSVKHLMDMCDLHDFANQDHRKLSGGQRQRLLLALALVNDPDILFLDEPTTGLDPQARFRFWQLINEVKGQGKTIILTTHYMDEAQQLCDHIEVMDNGKIIEKGAPNALLNHYFPGEMMVLPQQELNEEFVQAHNLHEMDGTWTLNTHNIEVSLKAMLQQGVNLEGMQIKSATLDDLFLHLTGHDLRGKHV